MIERAWAWFIILECIFLDRNFLVGLHPSPNTFQKCSYLAALPAPTTSQR